MDAGQDFFDDAKAVRETPSAVHRANRRVAGSLAQQDGLFSAIGPFLHAVPKERLVAASAFLADADLRDVTLPANTPFRLIGLVLGQGEST